jgi:hypothetical protein
MNRKLKLRALPAVLLVASLQAKAMLFCYNEADNVSMTWSNGVFSYSEGDVVVGNPGPQLLEPYYERAFCWANGVELDYLYTNFPNLRWPAVQRVNHLTGQVTFRAPIQAGALPQTVYFTDQDALFILNNL